MDKETVYQAITSIETQRKAERRWPAVALIEELELTTGTGREELRPYLLELYRDERIDCGHTLNSAYVTTVKRDQS